MFSLLAAGNTSHAADDAIPKPTELWPGAVPGATGTSDEDKPAIYPYLPPADKNTGAAILICPGGGFTTRCADFEGVLVAQWLKARGIASFILRYRIRPLYGIKDSVRDANRAMQYVYEHAKEYRIDPKRVGIMGFSAGAELAAAATFASAPGNAESADPVDRHGSRASFLVLAYGSSPLGGRGLGNRPPAGTGATVAPPTYMFCTGEDASHITGMVDLYTALRRARVPVEAHFFALGEHGVGLAQGDPVLGQWPELMHTWIKAGGFLSAQTRVAVSGLVKLDGEPLIRGSVIFTPIDGAGAPPVTCYVMNTGLGAGKFAARADRGPTPGRYRVEVRQDATRWLSNSVNPMTLKMTRKQRTGGLTEQDRKDWNEYARARDLSPSIAAQKIFRKKHPSDAKEQVIEFKAGANNAVEIDVFSK
ncbi:MAG TPA: alpha/beta hydrolase [Fimbriiglobus sp.]